MNLEANHPSHLKRPLHRLLFGIALFAIGVPVIFIATERLLPVSGKWHPYVSALPGLALCSLFLVLFLYLRHHDELKRRLGTQALAASAVVGVGALVVSVSRSAIGGYEELRGGLIIIVMAVAFLAASLFLSWRHR